MGTVLVTVAYGARRRDLAVRSDVPITDLLGPLVEAFAIDPSRPGGATGEGLGLALVCGPSLPVDRSLAACGIGDGAVLVLLDRTAAPRGGQSESVTSRTGPRRP
jgi:hypothetical protein